MHRMFADICSYIVTLAEVFERETGLASRSISLKAAGHSKLIERLAAGHDITTRRAAGILQWFSDNCPVGLFWPPHIPRPAPSPDSPAAQALAALAPATALNAEGEIANLADWCRRNAYEPDDARYVIRNYGAGGPREGRYPRRDTSAQFVLDQLIKTGDRRFAAYHRYDQIARQAGL